MPYIQDALGFIVEVLVGLYLLAAILRFLFQLLRVDFHNPISQAIVKVTNAPLKFLRRFVPGLFGIDLASIVLIIAVAMIKIMLLTMIAGHNLPIQIAFIWAIAEFLNTVCWILLIAIFVRAILSWVAPQAYHPGIRIINGLTEPILAPFRRLLPNLGGIDLSPIIAIIAINLIQKLIVAPIFASI